MATVKYCEASDVQARLSTPGVTLRLDDLPTSPVDQRTAVLNEIIDDASQWIDFYCGQRYDQTSLQQSDWVRFRCRDIAVYLLHPRRNNPVPKPVQDIYDEAVTALEKVQAAKANIPGVSMRRTPGPVLSQHRSRLWPYPHTVTERSRSTGDPPTGYSRRDDPIEPPIPGN